MGGSPGAGTQHPADRGTAPRAVAADGSRYPESSETAASGKWALMIETGARVAAQWQLRVVGRTRERAHVHELASMALRQVWVTPSRSWAVLGH